MITRHPLYELHVVARSETVRPRWLMVTLSNESGRKLAVPRRAPPGPAEPEVIVAAARCGLALWWVGGRVDTCSRGDLMVNSAARRTLCPHSGVEAADLVMERSHEVLVGKNRAAELADRRARSSGSPSRPNRHESSERLLEVLVGKECLRPPERSHGPDEPLELLGARRVMARPLRWRVLRGGPALGGVASGRHEPRRLRHRLEYVRGSWVLDVDSLVQQFGRVDALKVSSLRERGGDPGGEHHGQREGEAANVNFDYDG